MRNILHPSSFVDPFTAGWLASKAWRTFAEKWALHEAGEVCEVYRRLQVNAANNADDLWVLDESPVDLFNNWSKSISVISDQSSKSAKLE